MPHVPFRVKPLPGTQQTLRSKAPLTSQADEPSDLPAIPEVDVLDLDMPEMPVRTDRPQVPFAAPRRRTSQPSNSLLPTVSMKGHTVTPAQVAADMFGELSDGPNG